MESNSIIDPTENKEYFYTQLDKFYSDKKNMLKKPWSLERHEEIIQIIVDGKLAQHNKITRTNQQYYFGNHYDVVEVDGIRKVIKKRKDKSDPLIFLVPYEEIYDKLLEYHEITGHGGRDKMKTSLNQKFRINRTCIQVFLKCCKQCTEKKGHNNKEIVSRPFLNQYWTHRGQVDLIDFRSSPDRQYQWLLNYQDHLTKFVHLRPIESEKIDDISQELLKIFLEFGAPTILHCSYGRQFANHIINYITSKWSACKIINGKPQEFQSSDTVEYSNKEIENMLRSWMRDNNSHNWSIGCYFVQSNINSTYHGKIKRTPFKARFGTDFKFGLKSTNLPSESIENIFTEEELFDVMENQIDLKGANQMSQDCEEEFHCVQEDKPDLIDLDDKLVTNEKDSSFNMDSFSICSICSTINPSKTCLMCLSVQSTAEQDSVTKGQKRRINQKQSNNKRKC